MTTKILISMQDGIVQNVFANSHVEVCLIDWDAIKEGGDTELITSNNYGAITITDQELEEKIAEINELIVKNKEITMVTKEYEFQIIQSGYGKTLEEAWADALLTLSSQDMPPDDAEIVSEEDAPYMDW